MTNPLTPSSSKTSAAPHWAQPAAGSGRGLMVFPGYAGTQGPVVTAGAVDAETVMDRVYGEYLDPALREYAAGAIEAYLHHLRETGRIPPLELETK